MAFLYIKNMVCNRCIVAVDQELKKLGYTPGPVKLGEVYLEQEPSSDERKTIADHLLPLGFELLDDQRKKIIEKVKNGLTEKIQSGSIEDHFSLSNFISGLLNKDYSSVSRLFSEVEGQTLEQFYILLKIEKVKEWLTYDELTLSEISYRLGYSSVAHLSAQFKKITGMTPTTFRQQHLPHRTPLDEL